MKNKIVFILNYLILPFLLIFFVFSLFFLFFQYETSREIIKNFLNEKTIKKVDLLFWKKEFQNKEIIKKENKEIKYCKYLVNNQIEDLNIIYLSCSKNWKIPTIYRFKFLNIELPSKKEKPGYKKVKEYLLKEFRGGKKPVIIKLLGSTEKDKYVYVFYRNEKIYENINYKILKNNFPFVKKRNDLYDLEISKLELK